MTLAQLRRKLVDFALPVLQGWYARLRRDAMTKDACTVAAHMAFIYGDAPAAAAAEDGGAMVAAPAAGGAGYGSPNGASGLPDGGGACCRCWVWP